MGKNPLIKIEHALPSYGYDFDLDGRIDVKDEEKDEEEDEEYVFL